MRRDVGVARPLVWSEPGRTTREIKTGGWRTRRPQYVERPAACQLACPAEEPIPAWLARAEAGDCHGAWELIRRTNPFPAVTGRVCSHSCEATCNRGKYDGAVAINALERFIGDWGLLHGHSEPPLTLRTEKVAVVGGGPAGLACTYHLARLGYQVGLYEAMAELGGLLRYGIPEYRLPRTVLDREIELILDFGVTVHTRACLGEAVSWETLDSYQAVFLATGADCPVSLGIPGEASPGVSDGLAFLREVNSGYRPRLGRRVVVVGGGSTAIDVARTARRLGADVTIVALEAREAMPALAEEVEQALAEGVSIINEVGVEEIQAREGRATGARVRPAKLAFTESGTVRPVFANESPIVLEADAFLLAIGQLPDAALLPPGIRVERGLVTVGEGGVTSQPRLYAGGDLAPGPRSVAYAVGSGTRAARAIHRFLSGEDPGKSSSSGVEGRPDHVVTYPEINLDYFSPAARAERSQRGAAERVASFAEVVQGLNELQVPAEARRCFSCGSCTGCDTCLIFCPDMAIRRINSRGYEILSDYCKGCGLCARECPRGALIMVPERC